MMIIIIIIFDAEEMEASSIDILLEPLDTDDVSEVEDVDETKVRT